MNQHLFDAVSATGQIPQDEFLHKGTAACAVLSHHIFDIFMKVRDSATPEKIKRYKQLEQAYVEIVNDLSHVYRLEKLVGTYQHRLEKAILENKELIKENEKLAKTIEATSV